MTNTSLSVGLAPVRDLLVLVGRAQGGGGGLLGVELGQGGGAGSVHLHGEILSNFTQQTFPGRTVNGTGVLSIE